MLLREGWLHHRHYLENESSRDKGMLNVPFHTPYILSSWPVLASRSTSLSVWFILLPHSDSMDSLGSSPVWSALPVRKEYEGLAKTSIHLCDRISHCKWTLWHSGFISLVNVVHTSPLQRDGSALWVLTSDFWASQQSDRARATVQ